LNHSKSKNRAVSSVCEEHLTFNQVLFKERPIIFSSESIQAILDGRKTQTRRVIKPQPFKGAWNATSEHPSYGWFWKRLYQNWEGEDDFFKRLVKQCPYGQVGLRLWVRRSKQGKFIWKKAEAEIWLEITGLGVERLQVITLPDAEKEGFALAGYEQGCSACDTKNHSYYGGIIHFAEYWDSLNAKRGYGWEANPWVWVIEFKRQNRLDTSNTSVLQFTPKEGYSNENTGGNSDVRD